MRSTLKHALYLVSDYLVFIITFSLSYFRSCSYGHCASTQVTMAMTIVLYTSTTHLYAVGGGTDAAESAAAKTSPAARLLR